MKAPRRGLRLAEFQLFLFLFLCFLLPDVIADVLFGQPDRADAIPARPEDGSPMDNVFIERLWRSLKYEYVYRSEIATGSQARTGIGLWMDFYDRRRPHSVLNDRTPQEAYTDGRDCSKVSRRSSMHRDPDSSLAVTKTCPPGWGRRSPTRLTPAPETDSPNSVTSTTGRRTITRPSSRYLFGDPLIQSFDIIGNAPHVGRWDWLSPRARACDACY